ncbi:hypothetical protein PF010_g28113 [Phytophthora fragariae]|uniref:Uncharacterized protein n=1 Tax=Phytophthora fragariae TaxID=53985 RepID=A0A6G0JSG6_9STRA|nr:hypothetical protein PF010_g28113 [Phytophthora fragariae]
MSSRQSPLPSRSSSRTPQRPTLRAPPPASSTRTSRRKTSRSQITPRARSARARAAQTQHLQSVLAMLEDREEVRREELDQHPTEPDGNDLDVTSTWPILEGIYRDGDAEACGGTWAMLSQIFKVKTPTFIKTVTGFIEVVAPKLYEEWVASQADQSTMRALVTSGHTFQNFPSTMYATDATFQ